MFFEFEISVYKKPSNSILVSPKEKTILIRNRINDNNFLNIKPKIRKLIRDLVIYENSSISITGKDIDWNEWESRDAIKTKNGSMVKWFGLLSDYFNIRDSEKDIIQSYFVCVNIIQANYKPPILGKI